MSRSAPAVTRALCALTAVATLALCGCGGGSDASSGETSSPSASEVPQGGSAPPSAEQEVEEAGKEAEGSEAAAILSAERGYLRALAARDDARACALLSKKAIESLESSISHAKGQVSCAEILSKVLGRPAAASARSQAAGEIRKVRVLGDQALVVFHAPGARLFVFSLVKEDGEWRAATVISSVLAPSAATLEGAG